MWVFPLSFPDITSRSHVASPSWVQHLIMELAEVTLTIPKLTHLIYSPRLHHPNSFRSSPPTLSSESSHWSSVQPPHIVDSDTPFSPVPLCYLKGHFEDVKEEALVSPWPVDSLLYLCFCTCCSDIYLLCLTFTLATRVSLVQRIPISQYVTSKFVTQWLILWGKHHGSTNRATYTGRIHPKIQIRYSRYSLC